MCSFLVYLNTLSQIQLYILNGIKRFHCLILTGIILLELVHVVSGHPYSEFEKTLLNVRDGIFPRAHRLSTYEKGLIERLVENEPENRISLEEALDYVRKMIDTGKY